MLSAGAIVLLMALWQVGFDPFTFFSADEARYGASFLLPGNFPKNPWDELSLGLGYMLGLSGLPHVMTRFYTVPDAKTAPRSVVWVIFLPGAFFAGTTIFGLAAAHFVRQDAIRAADRGGNLTLPLLAQYLAGGKGSMGGEIMLGFVVAVATIIAVVAGLTLTTSGAIAHDLYVNIMKRGNVRERDQMMAARITAIVIGIVATLLGILAEGVNVLLVILAICIAASANFPVLVLSLFWRRFNTGGVIGGMASGLVSSVGLALIGPAYLGKDALWPLVDPTVVALLLGVLGAVLGTLLTRRNDAHERRFDEVVLRVHSGVRSGSGCESLSSRNNAAAREGAAPMTM